MDKFGYGNQVCKYFKNLYSKSTLAQFRRYDNLISQFKKRFKSGYCHLASASGRVEIIGNHTDHNGGVVLGCAVNLDIIAAFKPNGSDTVRMFSNGYSSLRYKVNSPAQLSGGAGLIEGVTTYLSNAGYNVGGFDICTDSSIPVGAGISSSAAFETLVATIVNECFNNGEIPQEAMAKAGQFAENRYLNKPCGLLDQGASLFGGITRFDFKNGFKCSRVDVNALPVKLILVNTGKSHSNLSRLYASIPEEMFAVAQYFGKERLIDVDAERLYSNEHSIRQRLGDRPYLRAKHFVEENARVGQMTEVLQQGNADEVIRLINASGDSSMYQLQNCAVDESDTAIVDAIRYARTLGNVGARVHGGGFAGTVLCVVKACDFKNVFSKLSQKYGEQRVLPMTIRQVGATVL